jgi:hypothetical protein
MDRALQRDVAVPPLRRARRDTPVPRRCHACGYDGFPLDASIAAVQAEIAACEHHLQRINASRRDSYREPVDGTTRTIKHTRREVERRLAYLARTLRWIASTSAAQSAAADDQALRRAVSDDVMQGGLACPRCGACEDAETDDETRERRVAFVREMLGSAVGHAGGVDPMELERRVWQLAAKYIT